MNLTAMPAEADKLPCVQLDTAAVPHDEQFALWQSYMQGHAVSPFGTGRSFAAQAECWQVGPMLITPSRIDPVRVVRAEQQIRLDGMDHYNFFLLVEGSWEGELGKRQVSARPGDIHVIDFAQQLATRAATATYTISVQFPRALIDEAIIPFDMHGLTIPGAAGRLAADFILALVGRLPEFTRADMQGVVRSTRDVLAAGLAAIPRGAQAPTIAALLAAAKRHIRGNLAADLAPDALARGLGTSRSTLYRAFEAVGGIEAFVREQRLGRAREMLANPQERRTITEIAFATGYASSAHFSRAFRSRYGYTPGEARHLAAHPFSELHDPAETAELERYNAWKERLR